MKSVSIASSKPEIFHELQACRRKTLELFTDIDQETFCQQAHPDFSPIGWHLGHIAFTEAYWILEKWAGLPPQFPQYHRLFHTRGLPKIERQNLPSIEATLDYLNTIRTQIFSFLKNSSLAQQERLLPWLIQHESQHNETILFILQLLHRSQNSYYPQLNLSQATPTLETLNFQQMVEIPAGEFYMGSNRIEAQDNEKPARQVYLKRYWMDTYPVTCAQYRQFMEYGGYQKQEFWSDEGWQWLQKNPVSHPLYWLNSPDWDNHPVCGVSYYEAEAYANSVGKRLPTEAEWEKAASWDASIEKKRYYPWGNREPQAKLSNFDGLVGHTTPVNAYGSGCSFYGCYDMLGNVWEWTTSWFSPYEGFQAYPYQGYSQGYFDSQHRVLRGGSWATRRWGLRNSWRNWYNPWIREVLVGFRCVKDDFS